MPQSALVLIHRVRVDNLPPRWRRTGYVKVKFRCGTSAAETEPRVPNNNGCVEWTSSLTIEIQNADLPLIAVVSEQIEDGGLWHLIDGGRFDGPVVNTLASVWRQSSDDLSGPRFLAEVSVIMEATEKEKSAARSDRPPPPYVAMGGSARLDDGSRPLREGGDSGSDTSTAGFVDAVGGYTDEWLPPQHPPQHPPQAPAMSIAASDLLAGLGPGGSYAGFMPPMPSGVGIRHEQLPTASALPPGTLRPPLPQSWGAVGMSGSPPSRRPIMVRANTTGGFLMDDSERYSSATYDGPPRSRSRVHDADPGQPSYGTRPGDSPLPSPVGVFVPSRLLREDSRSPLPSPVGTFSGSRLHDANYLLQESGDEDASGGAAGASRDEQPVSCRPQWMGAIPRTDREPKFGVPAYQASTDDDRGGEMDRTRRKLGKAGSPVDMSADGDNFFGDGAPQETAKPRRSLSKRDRSIKSSDGSIFTPGVPDTSGHKAKVRPRTGEEGPSRGEPSRFAEPLPLPPRSRTPPKAAGKEESTQPVQTGTKKKIFFKRRTRSPFAVGAAAAGAASPSVQLTTMDTESSAQTHGLGRDRREARASSESEVVRSEVGQARTYDLDSAAGATKKKRVHWPKLKRRASQRKSSPAGMMDDQAEGGARASEAAIQAPLRERHAMDARMAPPEPPSHTLRFEAYGDDGDDSTRVVPPGVPPLLPTVGPPSSFSPLVSDALDASWERDAPMFTSTGAATGVFDDDLAASVGSKMDLYASASTLRRGPRSLRGSSHGHDFLLSRSLGMLRSDRARGGSPAHRDLDGAWTTEGYSNMPINTLGIGAHSPHQAGANSSFAHRHGHDEDSRKPSPSPLPRDLQPPTTTRTPSRKQLLPPASATNGGGLVNTTRLTPSPSTSIPPEESAQMRAVQQPPQLEARAPAEREEIVDRGLIRHEVDRVLFSCFAPGSVFGGMKFELSISAYLNHLRDEVMREKEDKDVRESGLPKEIPIMNQRRVTVKLDLPEDVFVALPPDEMELANDPPSQRDFIWNGKQAEVSFLVGCQPGSQVGKHRCEAKVIQGSKVTKLVFHVEVAAAGMARNEARKLNTQIEGVKGDVAIIPWEELDVGDLIGEGVQGFTFSGLWLDKPVAIKCLIGCSTSHEFETEASILSLLGHHPNIVQFYGVSRLGETVYIVTKLEEGGGLDEALGLRGPWETNGPVVRNYSDSNNGSGKSNGFSGATKVRWARDIGRGLANAHGAGVVHNDVASRNALLSRPGHEAHALLCDFGLSKLLGRGSVEAASLLDVKETKARWPVRQMPSESLQHPFNLSSHSDTWMFGTMLYEMFEGQKPFAGIDDAQVMKLVCEGRTLKTPEALTNQGQGLVSIFEACLDPDWSQRMSMDSVVDALSAHLG